MTFKLFAKGTTTNILAVTLTLILCTSTAIGILLTTQPLDNSNPLNQTTPTPTTLPTQTTNTQNPPGTPAPTSGGTPQSNPTPTTHPNTSPTTSPQSTSTAKPSPTAANTPTPSPTAKPTATATPTTTVPPPTATATPTPTPTPTLTPTQPKGLLDDLSPQQKTEQTTTQHAANGNWSGEIQIAPKTWSPSTPVRLAAALNFSAQLLTNYKLTYQTVTNCCLLITAERDFDGQGNQRTAWNYQVSTILTPSGLPIEGGGSSAISPYAGASQKTPVDLMVEVPLSSFTLDSSSQWYMGKFFVNFTLPDNLPPGIYRLRLDFGFKTGNNRYDFNANGGPNNNGLGTRTLDPNTVSCVYSPPFPASGYDASGKWVDASQINRREFWCLLWDYNSNGYRGVVANEDKSKVAISPRNLIHDEVILPRFGTNGNPLYYNLEPMFLLDIVNSQHNIPWQYNHGGYSVKITYPNGTIKDLGAAAFIAQRGYGATTQNTSFTAWRPPVYGNYTVEAKGWIEDIWGNRYEGGGNYSFWIAERLTLATATFQGQAYNVGNRYGRDMAFNPPCPANVTVKASLYVNSDPNNVTVVTSTGQATAGGIFGSAQGLKPLSLTAPGEYYATVLGTYWDPAGTLWVCAMTHAGVVYSADSTIEAHGKKMFLPTGSLVDRGEKHMEGYASSDGSSVLDHTNYPYNSNDVLEITSEQAYANKIEPVLTYTVKGSSAPYDWKLIDLGKSNLAIKTSNGYSAEMFPEYITDFQYYYSSAPKPGFNARFIIAQESSYAPYWPTSPNNFGGQIGASNNGDLPGDIYRLLGGVVVRNIGQTPQYAGYQASAFILPKGTNDNRIVGPGDEDLPSPDGVPARFFLVPVRPGMVYIAGTSFGGVLQIDPVVPCNVEFSLTAPNGTTFTTTGVGDQYGYFIATERWTLDKPGLWKYTVNATWNGYQGKVPGLPEDGGWIFVLENEPAPATGMTLKMPAVQTFSATSGFTITGNTSATQVYYAAITPGAVLEEGTLQVTNGTFTYNFSPQRIADKIRTYDIVNLVNGRAEIGRVVHLTFFSEEQGSDGTYHSFARVVLRGTTAMYIKER